MVDKVFTRGRRRVEASAWQIKLQVTAFVTKNLILNITRIRWHLLTSVL